MPLLIYDKKSLSDKILQKNARRRIFNRFWGSASRFGCFSNCLGNKFSYKSCPIVLQFLGYFECITLKDDSHLLRDQKRSTKMFLIDSVKCFLSNRTLQISPPKFWSKSRRSALQRESIFLSKHSAAAAVD